MDYKKCASRWKIDKNLSESYNFSDHYIMEILFDFNPMIYDIPDRITWNFDENKIKIFQQNVKLNMEKWTYYYDKLYLDKNSLNKLIELFQLLFVQSCIDTFGFKKYNGNNFQWLSKKVLDLLEKRKKIQNNLSHLVSQVKRKKKGRCGKIY